MSKFFRPATGAYLEVQTPAHRSWITWLFLLPVIAYVGLRAAETPLTQFIIPFFPDEPDKSFAFYRDFVRLCINEGLWLSFFLFLTWVFAAYTHLPHKIFSGSLATAEYRMSLYALIVFLAALLIARYVLQTFPNSADEYVYLYQANTLSQGQLAEAAHPLQDFFHFSHIATKEGISVGRFPPGWPLLLSIPYALGVPPHWLNPVLGAVALLLFYRFCVRFYNKPVAFWSTLVMAFTGYYLFNAASYFSHTACLLFTVGFVHYIHRWDKERSLRDAWIAGLFLGAIALTRYFNAVLIFIPFLICYLSRERWMAFRTFIVIGLGVLPFLAFLGWYNYSITGNAWLPVTVWADPQERLGFVKGHTVVKAVDYSIRRVFLFLYWASPAILLLYFVFLYQKVRNRAARVLHPEDYYLLLLFAGYFFYHHPGGNQYGPRFLFEALPFATVFVVNQVWTSRRRWTLALLIAGSGYAVVKMPYLIAREHQVVDERLDLYDQVQAAGLSNAVVFIDSHTGVIRPMPVRDLTRNALTDNNAVIYAEDLGSANHVLRAYYPERVFYRYIRPNKEIPEGRLERLP